jgi:large subunit ribosomal protein L3
VTQAKTKSADGVTALQLGAGAKRARRLRPSYVNQFTCRGLSVKARLAQFPVTTDALLPVGTQLTAAHFVAGQHVDVTGVQLSSSWFG